jgi:hypothetical protein
MTAISEIRNFSGTITTTITIVTKTTATAISKRKDTSEFL